MALAEEARIVIADINFESAQSVAAEVKGIGRRAIAIDTDVTDSKDVNQMVQKPLSTSGADK